LPKQELRITFAGGSRRSYCLALSGAGLWLAAAAGLALLALVIFGVVSYVRLARVAAKADELARQNELLLERSARIGELKAEIDRLRSFEAKMLQIMGIDTLNVRRSRYAELWEGGAAEGSAGRAAEAGKLKWPVPGTISRGYTEGGEGHGGHLGLDIAAPAGTPVRAAARGLVKFAGTDSVYGKVVVLEHAGGLETVYGHNSELLVVRGDTVSDGQIIALVGSTGRSSAPHVHFEVIEDGENVDPLKWLETRR